MPDDNDRKYLTRLTRFIDVKWRASGQNQKEFVLALFGDEARAKAFGSQTLSKYIRGRLAVPPHGLVNALTQRYDIDRDELELMAVTPEGAFSPSTKNPHATAPVLQFLMGHTVWTANFIIAMLESPRSEEARFATRSGIRLASRFASGMDKEICEWYYHDKEELPEDFVETVQANPDIRWEPLSAPTIIERLEDTEFTMQERVVTFGLLPWELAVERQEMPDCQGRFIKLATLMDSAAACSVIVPSDNEIDMSGQAFNNTLTSGALIRSLAREGNEASRRRIVLGEHGSVSGELATWIAESAQRLLNLNDKRQDVEVLAEHYSTVELEDAAWADLIEEFGSIEAIIAWDPQATGMVRRADRAEKRRVLKRYNLIEASSSRGGPAHTTLDIVLYVDDDLRRNSWWESTVQAGARKLFFEILPQIQIEQLKLLSLRSNRNEMNLLKKFFRFDKMDPPLFSQEVERVFSNIRYSTSIDPSGMAEVLNLPPLRSKE